MFCKNCGSEINDIQAICLNCGCKVGDGTKYCANCGSELNENALFCDKCGSPVALSANETVKESKDENSDKENAKKLFTAHILNIIAFVIMVMSLVLQLYGMYSPKTMSASHSVNGKETSNFSATMMVELHPERLFIMFVASLIVFLIGIIIYKSKNYKAKQGLSIAYISLAILLIAGAFYVALSNVVETCGFSFIMLASNIIQIIVGGKYLVALKKYEN